VKIFSILPDLVVKLIDFGYYIQIFFQHIVDHIDMQHQNASIISHTKGSADMCLLGVVLFVMISGKLPWMDSNLKSVINKNPNMDFNIFFRKNIFLISISGLQKSLF
jgi:hypothetical protein